MIRIAFDYKVIINRYKKISEGPKNDEQIDILFDCHSVVFSIGKRIRVILGFFFKRLRKFISNIGFVGLEVMNITTDFRLCCSRGSRHLSLQTI